jgi:hypothetical protein
MTQNYNTVLKRCQERSLANLLIEEKFEILVKKTRAKILYERQKIGTFTNIKQKNWLTFLSFRDFLCFSDLERERDLK